MMSFCMSLRHYVPAIGSKMQSHMSFFMSADRLFCFSLIMISLLDPYTLIIALVTFLKEQNGLIVRFENI